MPVIANMWLLKIILGYVLIVRLRIMKVTDHEMSAREKKKNKRNSKKKGKVMIVAGVMTREQDSDSTLPPEGRKGKWGYPHLVDQGRG